MGVSQDHAPSITAVTSGQPHTWEVVGDEVAQAVGTALEPVLERARDNLYGTLLDAVQDYLSENLAFNIASRISAANREARQLRAINAELLEALRALVEEFGGSIEQYNKIGPDWTFKDGTEGFNASTLLDREPLIEAARAAVSKAGDV